MGKQDGSEYGHPTLVCKTIEDGTVHRSRNRNLKHKATGENNCQTQTLEEVKLYTSA